jgi:hypothetical protein
VAFVTAQAVGTNGNAQLADLAEGKLPTLGHRPDDLRPATHCQFVSLKPERTRPGDASPRHTAGKRPPGGVILFDMSRSLLII